LRHWPLAAADAAAGDFKLAAIEKVFSQKE
jgi:hypothetical protein